MAIKRSFLRQLKKILGPEHVRSESVDLISYSYDGTILSSATPDAVVHPGSREEVRAVMQTAFLAGVPVVPRGSSTGLSGGSLAVRGGVILHFDRMDRIRKLASSDMAVIVEPGIINRDLKRAVAVGLFYPPDPSSQNVCTIGGNVAENAGGPYGFKYGVTGDYVLGLEAILSSGEVIRTGNTSRRIESGVTQ